MEEIRKRPMDNDPTTDPRAPKRSRTPSVFNDADDDMLKFFTVDESTAAELSNLLATEPTNIQPFKVKFIDDPFSTSLTFQSTSSYITINGNEESCGSSFSDVDSSFMASIYMGSVKSAVSSCLLGEEGGAYSADVEEALGWIKDTLENDVEEAPEGILVKEKEMMGILGNEKEGFGGDEGSSDEFDVDKLLVTFFACGENEG